MVLRSVAYKSSAINPGLITVALKPSLERSFCPVVSIVCLESPKPFFLFSVLCSLPIAVLNIQNVLELQVGFH